MSLLPTSRDAESYLRTLANWGLGLAGLPLALDPDQPATIERIVAAAKTPPSS